MAASHGHVSIQFSVFICNCYSAFQFLLHSLKADEGKLTQPLGMT